MVDTISPDFTSLLKSQVAEHEILRHPWIQSQKENFSSDALKLWLCQEYHVSVSFVNWFLYTAAQTDNQDAKIILIQNIWEELGEGNLEDTHVSILQDFLDKLSVPPEFRSLLPGTEKYLNRMIEITQKSFYHGIGALGPANEYLLKLEYFQMSLLYNHWRESNPCLPEAKFFAVNLDADEGHAKRLFDLIQSTADTQSKKDLVIEGNLEALSARVLFYDGLFELLDRQFF